MVGGRRAHGRRRRNTCGRVTRNQPPQPPPLSRLHTDACPVFISSSSLLASAAWTSCAFALFGPVYPHSFSSNYAGVFSTFELHRRRLRPRTGNHSRLRLLAPALPDKKHPRRSARLSDKVTRSSGKPDEKVEQSDGRLVCSTPLDMSACDQTCYRRELCRIGEKSALSSSGFSANGKKKLWASRMMRQRRSAEPS